MNGARLWPLSVAGVLFVTVAANVVMLVLAGDPHASAVEPDYYAKALAFDSTRAEADRSAELGWNAGASIRRTGEVEVRLATAGRPIEGARVRVVAIHNLDADERPAVELRDAGGGRYEGTLPLRYAGLYELRIAATRGAARFETVLHAEAR